MSIKFIFIPLCAFLTFHSAQAAVKVVVDSNTVSRLDDTTDTSGNQTVTLYAGYSGAIGDCTTPSSTSSVCNACTALDLCNGTNVYQCAERSIHPDLLLTMQVTVDQVPTNPQLLIQWNDSTGGDITPQNIPTSFAAGTPFTVQLKWSDICSKAGMTNCSDTASKGVSGSLLVGLSDGTSTTFASGAYAKINVKLNYARPDEATALVPNPINPNPDSTYGFTDFQVDAGDGKVFVSDIYRGNTGWYNVSSGTKWQALRVYYGEFNTTPDFCQIAYNSGNYADLTVEDKVNKDTTLSSNKVGGLTNDLTYMFNIASVDETTIVTGFIDPHSLTTVVPSRYVAQPGEVVGLLDNKKCFIATAAFGSQMAPQVELLRQFRNHFLVPYAAGRKFVHLYYKYSPPAAEFISQHDSLRAVVRTCLWPLILFADVSLQFGFVIACGILLLSILSLLLLARLVRRSV